jgi:hypothetical protein
LGIIVLDATIAHGVGASEFSLPLLGSAFTPAGVGVEGAVGFDVAVVTLLVDELVCFGARGFLGLRSEIDVVDERQPFRPARVEEVGFFGGRPRRVFIGPGVSLRCMCSSRSARRCPCSVRCSFTSSSEMRCRNPAASVLGSPSAPGASAKSIAFKAFVSS